MPQDKWFNYKVTYFIKPSSLLFIRKTDGRDLPEALKLFYRAHSGLDIRIHNIEQLDDKEKADADV